ncbi:hypothetical protein WDU94_001415 [Cyamophila willieti]
MDVYDEMEMEMAFHDIEEIPRSEEFPCDLPDHTVPELHARVISNELGIDDMTYFDIHRQSIAEMMAGKDPLLEEDLFCCPLPGPIMVSIGKEDFSDTSSFELTRTQKMDQQADKYGFRPFFRNPLEDYTYRGFWKNNKRWGQGYAIFGQEKFIYEGNFENDKFHGFGRLSKILPNDNTELLYTGYWANGKKNGRGCLYHSENKGPDCERHENREKFDGAVHDTIDDESLDRGKYNETTEDVSNLSITDSISKELSNYLENGDLSRKCTKRNLVNDNSFESPTVSIAGLIQKELYGQESPQESCSLNPSRITSMYENENKSDLSLGAIWYSDDLEKMKKRSNSEDNQSRESQLGSHMRAIVEETDKPLVDSNKHQLKFIKGRNISFQQLKQIYNEFQNRVREEEKHDTWDEFVNTTVFRSRPDPNQKPLDYVTPNYKDINKRDCVKGIFYRNDIRNKIVVKENENLEDLLKNPENLKRIKYLDVKKIDEKNLKFYKYEGNMKDDFPDGWGLAYYKDNVYYYGTWKTGQFHGQGILMAKHEFSFEGQFENGERQGNGVYINYRNGYVQRGYFVKGSFVESTVTISHQRQSAVYPVIYPIPKLDLCDPTLQTVDAAVGMMKKHKENKFRKYH